MKPFIAVVICLCLHLGGKEPRHLFLSQVDMSKKFIEEIQREKKSIRIVVNRLSQVEVVEALIEALQRGVLVEVIVDSVSITKKTVLHRLAKAGACIFVWEGESGEDLGHMRYCFALFGAEISWTGSYSLPLKPKTSSYESSLVLEDPEVVKGFLAEFSRIKEGKGEVFSSYVSKKEGIL